MLPPGCGVKFFFFLSKIALENTFDYLFENKSGNQMWLSRLHNSSPNKTGETDPS